MSRCSLITVITALVLASVASATTCMTSSLNQTVGIYPVTVAGTTVADIAKATGRGICNIARYNFMADESIVPNVGQTIVIPPEVCPEDIDNVTCVLNHTLSANKCVLGGPRLYYTVNQDTYAKIANRLDVNVRALTTGNASEILAPGQFIKVPLCEPSVCSFRPYQFQIGDWKVYKDLAVEFGSTVGQFMMLSATYNYSSAAYEKKTPPTVTLPFNCTTLSPNITVIT